jgi:PAS domain S-box-containing protein
MDTNVVFTHTADGIMEKVGDLHYDAVRLLRKVDGMATVGDLRPQFSDLSDARFLKAMLALQHKCLVRALRTTALPAVDPSEKPHVDAQVSEIAQEVLQTLDFTKLDRNLLDAMRTGSAQPAAAASTAATRQPPAIQPVAPAPARARPEPAAKVQPALERLEADTYAQLVAALQPNVEAELRAALRPEIEDELRRQLVVALRPALEAEIRIKLTAALKPRVEFELRMKNQLAHATAAQLQPLHQLFECMQEAIFQTDPAGKTVYVNPAWMRLMGCAADDAIGKLLSERFCGEDQRKVAAFLEGIAAGKAIATAIEADLTREKGEPRRVEVRATPLIAAAGDLIGVCGILRGMSQAQDRATKS